MLARHFSVFESWNEPDDSMHSGLRLPRCPQYAAAGQRPSLLGSIIIMLASLVNFSSAVKLYQRARKACQWTMNSSRQGILFVLSSFVPAARSQSLLSLTGHGRNQRSLNTRKPSSSDDKVSERIKISFPCPTSPFVIASIIYFLTLRINYIFAEAI